MKLFLSSFRIPNTDAFTSFVGKKPTETSIGLVFNAKDCKTQEEREISLADHIRYYSERGFSVTEVNLLKHDSLDSLETELRKYDVLWFNGGNTYCLRWAIKKSGAEPIIKKLLNEGVVYAGDSAGSVVAGPTIEHYESADDPTLAPEHLKTGLNLYKKAIVPHWGSEKWKEILDETEKDLQDAGFETVRLTDEEYLTVEI